MAVKLVKKTEQKTEETKKGTGRISLVPTGKEVTAPETFSTKPVEKKQEERSNINTAQEQSGKSRDEFDSSVRSAYAQRLQQEQERMAAQQKQEEENAVKGGSFGGGAAKESDRGGFTGNRVEGVAWNDQPSRAGNVIVGAGKDYMGSLMSALGAMAQTAGDRNQANRAAQMLEEIYEPGTAPELVKQSAEKEKTTWEKVADMGDKLREEGKQLSAEGQAQTQQQKQGLGTLGQFAVDAGAGGVQMATDIGIGWLTGVGMTIPMAIRSLGAGVEKAKADGADLAGQLRYGLGTAAAAYGMEKLFGIAFAGLKVANPGIADDFVMEAINKLATKLATTPKGATAVKAIASLGASFGGEFAEEFLEAFVEPYIRRASYDPNAKSVFQDPSLLADYLYEGLIGGSIGLLGGSVNVAINTRVESGTDEDLKKAYRQYQSYFTEEAVSEAYASLKENGMFSTKAAQDVKKAEERLQKILPEQSKTLTEQQRADQAAYIEAAGLVDRAESDLEAAGAIFAAGNERTREEGAQPETRSEPGSEAAGENTAGQQKENAVDLSQYPALQKFVETGEMESPTAVLTEAVNAANDGVLRYEDSEAIAQQTMAEEARINSAAQAQPAAAVMEGANENGAELRVSGERGRGTGESAGRQSGTVPESAGGRQNRSVQNIRGRDRADAVAWEYEKAHADPISTRDLFGTGKGSEDAVLRVASSRVVQSDEELRSIDREIREAGYTPYFFTGMASITSGQQAPAYVRGKNVYIRIDHPKWTAAELWAHEKYHIMAAQNPGMVQQQWNELCRTMDGAALREMLKTYRDRYHGAYDIDENGNAVWSEDVMWKIVEEILADSYAGRDTYGTGVNAMTGDVRQMSQQRAGGERQTRGPPEGAFAVDDEGKENNYAGHEVREETRDEFLQRTSKGNGRIIEEGGISYGYVPVRDGSARPAAKETQRELNKLGIDCFVHDGVLEGNVDGKTYRAGDEATTVGKTRVGISNNIDLDPANTAGHEAFHMWVKSPDGADYVETLADNIDFASDAFRNLCTKIENGYYKNGVTLKNKTDAKRLLEEVFAYVTGDIHAGTTDTNPEELLRDPGAVKSAWKWLVSKKAPESGGSFALDEATDEAYMEAVERGDVETVQRMVDEAARNAGYDSPKLFHGTRAFGFTEFDLSMMDDGISIFTTSNPEMAGSYARGGSLREIAEGTVGDRMENLADTELLPYAKQYFESNGVELMSGKLRDFEAGEASEDLRELAVRIEEKINDLSWSFNADKEAAAMGIVDSLYAVANATTIKEMEKARRLFEKNNKKLWELDESIYDEYRKSFPISFGQVAEVKKRLIGNDVLYVDGESDQFATASEIRKEIKKREGSKGIYTIYGKTDDLQEIDAEGRYWNDIQVNGTETQTTREIAKAAKDYGWSGVLIRNVIDYADGKDEPGDVYIYFDSSQLKSADPVTYDDDGNVIPLSQRFNEEDTDIRFALDGETDERPWWESEDEEIRSAAEMMAERNKRDPAFDIDEYLSRKMQEAEAERADRLRNIPKSEFKGTQAMEKLGIKVDGSVTRYDNADQMRKRHAAAQSVKRELRKAENRLGATAQEKMFAGAIASGTITEDMIPQGVNRSTVMELADYYMAERAQGVDMIRQRRVDINRTLDERMGNLLKGLDKFKVNPILILNNRTPQRNMLKIFGGELGKRINEEIFDPVATNEAERIRFVNREYDKVRTFRDSKGKESKLTKEERALVQMVIEGRAVEEIVAGMEISNAIKYAAENIVNGKDPADAARQYSLDGKEQELAVKYARWLQAQEALRSGKVDNVKVENAANTYSKLFDQYYDAINDFLVVHGYEPIGFIKGYAPHLQPEANSKLLDKALEAMGLNRNVTNLPAEIAGKTADFRPNKRWNPYFLQRTGDQTDYDIATAFESYVDHLSDVLYHTDDIMRVRRMERFFRKAYSKEDLRSEIEWAEGLRDLKPEERLDALKDAGKVSKTASLSPEDTGAKIDEIIEDSYNNMDDLTKYGEFVMWLENYANILAGKQSMVDRGGEAGAGRRILNFGNYLTALFGKAQVAGNLSSVLNQTSQLPMILSEIGSINTLRAAADMMNGKLRRDFALESDVLTGKAGVNFLVHTPGEMIINTMFTPAQWMDSMLSTLAVRGAYHKAIRSGMNHEEAMKAADRYGRNVMGSREKGVKPLGFHAKNPLSQMLHVFQLEALNNWEHISQDLPQDFRKIEAEKGKAAAVAALAGVILKAMLSAFLLNRITEETYGGTPAPFDILGMSANFVASGEGLSTNEWLMTMLDNVSEELTGERFFDTEELERDGEFDASAAFADLRYNVYNEIPFWSNVSSLMGWGDQTLPWPDVVDTGSELLESIKEDGLVSGRTAQAALGVAGEFLPGGRQAVKSASGIQSVLQGGKMTGYGENKTLQFPTEQTPGSIARQVLFGVNATPEARSYWASGDSKLSAKQTQLWQRLVDGGADSQDVYDVIQSWRNVDGDKELDSQTRGKLQRNMIRNMDMTDEQKFDMYKTLTGADSGADEFRAMMRAGMSWDEVMDAYEKHQELENNSAMKSSEQAAAFVKWAYSNLSQKEANAAVEQLAFWTTMKAKPSQATLEEQLNKTKLTNKQKTAIWNSYGWKAESPWK